MGIERGEGGMQEVGGVPEGGLYILLYRLFILLDFVGIVFVHECAFLVITLTVTHTMIPSHRPCINILHPSSLRRQPYSSPLPHPSPLIFWLNLNHVPQCFAVRPS